MVLGTSTKLLIKSSLSTIRLQFLLKICVAHFSTKIIPFDFRSGKLVYQQPGANEILKLNHRKRHELSFMKYLMLQLRNCEQKKNTHVENKRLFLKSHQMSGERNMILYSFHLEFCGFKLPGQMK